MELVNQCVTHSAYGKGTITQQTDQTVTVQFESLPDAKNFIYPTAFSKFLTLEKLSLRIHMKEELDSYHQARADKLQERNELFAARLAEKTKAEDQKKRELLRQKRMMLANAKAHESDEDDE